MRRRARARRRRPVNESIRRPVLAGIALPTPAPLITDHRGAASEWHRFWHLGHVLRIGQRQATRLARTFDFKADDEIHRHRVQRHALRRGYRHVPAVPAKRNRYRAVFRCAQRPADEMMTWGYTGTILVFGSAFGGSGAARAGGRGRSSPVRAPSSLGRLGDGRRCNPGQGGSAVAGRGSDIMAKSLAQCKRLTFGWRTETARVEIPMANNERHSVGLLCGQVPNVKISTSFKAPKYSH